MAKYKRSDEMDDDLTYSQEVAQTQEPVSLNQRLLKRLHLKSDMAIFAVTRKL